MMKIKFSKLTDNARQVFKIENDSIKASCANKFNKCLHIEKHKMLKNEKKNKILFDKIIKYKTDLCTLGEIIEDNVLKR